MLLKNVVPCQRSLHSDASLRIKGPAERHLNGQPGPGRSVVTHRTHPQEGGEQTGNHSSPTRCHRHTLVLSVLASRVSNHAACNAAQRPEASSAVAVCVPQA